MSPPGRGSSTSRSSWTCSPGRSWAGPPPPASGAVQLTLGTALALVGGGTAVVLVVGAVLVSMLLAVAVTAASVAVCAVVLRSLISQHRR
ncbi:SpdD-like protein [Streptomyces fradiae]|uniref:SpdD-like protein n=1 Tax=Streptomyces fradiae TaxID=1906 RepID=UPI0039881A64